MDDKRKELVLKTLKELFKKDDDVVSFSLFGSLSKPDAPKDKWSDIDALLVVEDTAFKRFFPSLDWLKPAGEIFTFQQEAGERKNSTKVIFADFLKIDFVITSESQIMQGKPFWTKQLSLYAKTNQVKTILDSKFLGIIPPPPDTYNFDELVRNFWFLAFVTVTKVVRNDHLIAFDLSLDLYKYCLLLAMWLRDKKTGTHIHRTGGVGNDLVKGINIKISEISQKNILSLVEKCCTTFDIFAKKWSPDYQSKMPLFIKVLTTAKEDL